jgi:hypothetical protein
MSVEALQHIIEDIVGHALVESGGIERNQI